MDTPIFDFVRSYAEKGGSRFHMPGHKGMARLGCESWDITEIRGGDSLYEADGIIARSEENATALFGSGRTVYSTEGSSNYNYTREKNKAYKIERKKLSCHYSQQLRLYVEKGKIQNKY